MEQFKKIAYSFIELIGCEHLIFGFPELATGEVAAVKDLNINYPQEWVELYQTQEFWRIDPIVLTTMASTNPQHWSETYRKLPPDKNFITLAHDFGLQDGCSCLTRDNIGPQWTMVSTAGGFRNYKNKAEYILERLTPHFHLALLSLKVSDRKFQNITNRELEVLKWLSNGKTSWEISVILKVTEATINFHVKNIFKKLNVNTRSHAVAIAVYYKLIALT
ncbi:MAG: autoinducer binding domain-containing protein [Patescibacteria group bacterium]|nr:autoinducer binding domain-containing protein [Patescibacteria group bacterium]